MSKEKSGAASATGPSWFGEMFHAAMYKRTQGKIARQVTFGAMAATCCLAAWRLSDYLSTAAVSYTTDWVLTLWPLSYISTAGKDSVVNIVDILSLQYSLPLLIVALGIWISFRAVNIPRFADFLISVEAEMNKVSWPSKDELIRSSIVVIFVIVMMSALLYGYDALWTLIFGENVLGILQKTTK